MLNSHAFVWFTAITSGKPLLNQPVMKLEPASRLITRTARIGRTYIQIYNTYCTYWRDVHPGLQHVPHVLPRLTTRTHVLAGRTLTPYRRRSYRCARPRVTAAVRIASAGRALGDAIVLRSKKALPFRSKQPCRMIFCLTPLPVNLYDSFFSLHSIGSRGERLKGHDSVA